MIAAAITRSDVANYVGWVFYVYIIIIFVYIALNWLFAAGVHPPYSRWSDAVLTFLRDTSEPYLPNLGPCLDPIRESPGTTAAAGSAVVPAGG